MADVDLLFGVSMGGESGDSASEIAGQLAQILRDIEPLKVKVGVDVEASKKDFASDIKDLLKGTSKSLKLRFDVPDIGKSLSSGVADKAVKKAATNMQKAEAVAKNYYDTLREINAARKNGAAIELSSDGAFKSLSKDFDSLATRANEACREMDALKKSIWSMSSGDQKKIRDMLSLADRDYQSNMYPIVSDSGIKDNTGNIQEQVYTYKEAKNVISDYYSAIKNVTKNNADIQWDTIYGKYISKSGLFSEHAEVLNKTEAAYIAVVDAMNSMPLEEQLELQELLNKSREEYNISLEGSAGKERSAINYSDSARAVKDYYATLTKLERNEDAKKHISLIDNGYWGKDESGNDAWFSKYEYVSDIAEYENLASALNRTKTAFDAVVDARSELFNGQQARLQTLMTQEGQKYSLVVEEQANKVRLAKEKANDAVEAKKEAEAYNSAESAIINYYKAQKDAIQYRDEITRDASTGEWVTQSENLKDLVKRLNDTRDAYVDAAKSAATFSQENKDLFNKADERERQSYREAIADQNRKDISRLEAKSKADEAEALGKATAALREYYKAQTDAIKYRDQISKDNGSGSWISENENLASLVQRLNDTESAYNELSASVSQFSEKSKEAFNASRNKEVQAYNEAVETQNRKDNEVALKRYANQLEKINTLLAKTKKNLADWGASKIGKSSDAYHGLEQTARVLEEMQSELIQTGAALDNFDSRFDQASASAKSFSTSIEQAGENVKSIKSRLSEMASALGFSFTFADAFYKAVEIGKKMVDIVTDVDTAMTELKKVTEESDSTYARFLDNAKTRAHGLGATLADTISATADFARLGNNIADASSLADAAIVYKNVGDGIEDITTASESIISTMQAFGVEAKDAMSIVDSFNNVGNNFAISSKGIGDALLNSAASLHAAGNTIHESIALIAAANTTIQDPGKVGKCLPNNAVMHCKKIAISVKGRRRFRPRKDFVVYIRRVRESTDFYYLYRCDCNRNKERSVCKM